MRISGIAYIILGSFIAGTSFYIFKGKQLLMFYIISGALISFGILKLMIDKVREPKYEKMPRQPRQTFNQRGQPTYTSNQQYRYCHSCSALINYNQNFCHKCGVRVR